MNTWILDTAIARLLSTNAVVLTEQPNAQMVGKLEFIRKRGRGRDRSPDAGYAATRFSSNLNCRTSKFGWLQAPATNLKLHTPNHLKSIAGGPVQSAAPQHPIDWRSSPGAEEIGRAAPEDHFAGIVTF